MTLQWRIVVPFALLAATLAGVVGYDAARRVDTASERRLMTRMARTADLLSRMPAGYFYEAEWLAEVREVLGFEIAVAFAEETSHTLGRGRVDAEVARLLRRPKPAGTVESLTLNGVRYRARWAEPRGITTSALVLLMPEARVAEVRAEATQGILGFAALAALVAAVLGGWLARGVTRPLGQLVASTRAIADGELERRADPAGPAEVRALAVSVNAMVESLAASRQRLIGAEKQALLGRVATMVAHEVRNPLTSIKLAMQLRAEGADAAERDELAMLVREVERLELVTGELLTLGRPTPPRIAEIDVREPVERTLKLMAARFAHRGIDLAPTLPSEPLVAPVDSDRLQQLLTNLLLNALDAAPAGSAVEVALRGGEGVELAVTDRGPGVADPASLFEPFATTKETGTGLGLAVCAQIAEQHGGTIAHEPLEDGTRFVVRLPSA